MPRIARIVIPGVPHHITQRGNNRQDVFFVDEDRIIFLRFLKEQSQKFGMRIDGYCLMTNHIHIIATHRTYKSSLYTIYQLYAWSWWPFVAEPVLFLPSGS
jgi:putative transposase